MTNTPKKFTKRFSLICLVHHKSWWNSHILFHWLLVSVLSYTKAVCVTLAYSIKWDINHEKVGWLWNISLKRHSLHPLSYYKCSLHLPNEQILFEFFCNVILLFSHLKKYFFPLLNFFQEQNFRRLFFLEAIFQQVFFSMRHIFQEATFLKLYCFFSPTDNMHLQSLISWPNCDFLVNMLSQIKEVSCNYYPHETCKTAVRIRAFRGVHL